MEQLNRPANLPTKKLKNSYKELIRGAADVIQELFVILLVIYLLLFLTETIWGKSVLSYLDLNHLLIAVIITGVISVLTRNDAKPMAGEHPGKRGIIFIITVGLVGAAIIWYKTQEIGWLSYVISIVSGSLIVLLLALIWRGEEGGEVEGENSQDN